MPRNRGGTAVILRPDMRSKTYNTSVVLEVQENTVESLPGLGLSDNDGGVDLLSQLRLSLLDGGHDHVTDTTGGQAVQTSTDTLDGDDVQVTGTRVVGAVHDGTDGETEGHLELATRGTTTARTRLVSPQVLLIRLPCSNRPLSSSAIPRRRIMKPGAGEHSPKFPFLLKISSWPAGCVSNLQT